MHCGSSDDERQKDLLGVKSRRPRWLSMQEDVPGDTVSKLMENVPAWLSPTGETTFEAWREGPAIPPKSHPCKV